MVILRGGNQEYLCDQARSYTDYCLAKICVVRNQGAVAAEANILFTFVSPDGQKHYHNVAKPVGPGQDVSVDYSVHEGSMGSSWMAGCELAEPGVTPDTPEPAPATGGPTGDPDVDEFLKQRPEWRRTFTDTEIDWTAALAGEVENCASHLGVSWGGVKMDHLVVIGGEPVAKCHATVDGVPVRFLVPLKWDVDRKVGDLRMSCPAW